MEVRLLSLLQEAAAEGDEHRGLQPGPHQHLCVPGDVSLTPEPEGATAAMGAYDTFFFFF